MLDKHQVPVKVPVTQPCPDDTYGYCCHKTKPSARHYHLAQYACNKANNGKKYQAFMIKIEVLYKMHH